MVRWRRKMVRRGKEDSEQYGEEEEDGKEEGGRW